MNHWLDRAEEWDAELNRQEFDEQLQVARDMGRRHAQIAARGIEKAVRRLVDLDPNELSPSQVLSYISEFTRIERISRGDPEHLDALKDRAGASPVGDIRDDIEEFAPVFQSLLDRGLIQIEGQTEIGDVELEEDFELDNADGKLAD